MKKIVLFCLIAQTGLQAHVDHVCVDKTKLDQLTIILDQIIGILANLREQAASLSAEATQRSIDFSAWQALAAEQLQTHPDYTETKESNNNQKEEQ